MDFQPEPHTPGRIQSVHFGGFVRIDIVDTETPGLFNMIGYNLRVDREKPYSEVYGVDLETLYLVLEMYPERLEQLKAEYAANQIGQN